jgi:hypothetical protein
MRSTGLSAMLFASLAAGLFVTAPELLAYAANTVFSTDITDGEVKTVDLAGSAVTAAKIKDGEVKAAEIATDAVGARQLAGVTKLAFNQCTVPSDIGSISVSPDGFLGVNCPVGGVGDDDSAIATNVDGSECFAVTKSNVHSGWVQVFLVNVCSFDVEFGTNQIAIIVFDK